jgi:hypothetical protein
MSAQHLPPAAPKVISDHLCKDIERLTNVNIHELVFFLHHVEEDDHENALDTLQQVQMNLDTIRNKIGNARLRATQGRAA